MISSWQLKLSQMAGRSERQLRNSECQSLLSMIEFLVMSHLVPKWSSSVFDRWRVEGTEQLLIRLFQDWICSFKEANYILGRRNCCQENRQETRGGYDYHRVVEFLQETSPTTDSVNCKLSCLLTCCCQ